jgi:hypothetical protein
MSKYSFLKLLGQVFTSCLIFVIKVLEKLLIFLKFIPLPSDSNASQQVLQRDLRNARTKRSWQTPL